MSTILNTNGSELTIPRVADPSNFKAVVLTAEWNEQVTGALRDGALRVFSEAGIPEQNIRSYSVPGTVELVNAAARAMHTIPGLDAVVILGCVIRGDTPHFDYVCKIAADGCALLNSRGEAAVIFGVLTVENLPQALDRAGGSLGNKGAEAAVAAIAMSNLAKEMSLNIR